MKQIISLLNCQPDENLAASEDGLLPQSVHLSTSTIGKSTPDQSISFTDDGAIGHIDKLRMLRIRVYWGAQLELVDPDVTSTCPAMC